MLSSFTASRLESVLVNMFAICSQFARSSSMRVARLVNRTCHCGGELAATSNIRSSRRPLWVKRRGGETSRRRSVLHFAIDGGLPPCCFRSRRRGLAFGIPQSPLPLSRPAVFRFIHMLRAAFPVTARLSGASVVNLAMDSCAAVSLELTAPFREHALVSRITMHPPAREVGGKRCQLHFGC